MAKQKSKHQGYSLGPGASSLLLIVVVLCLTVLGILALGSARSDHRLSVRNEEMSVQYYTANAVLQENLAQLDAALDAARAQATDEAAYWAKVDKLMPDSFERNGKMATCTVDAGGNRALSMDVEMLPPTDLSGRYRVDSVVLVDNTEWEDVFIEGLITQEGEDDEDEE